MTHAHKAGRNDACPCGSGKKYKKCCELEEHTARGSNLMLIIVGVLIVAGLVVGIRAFTSEKDVARPGGVWSAAHGHYH